MSRQESYYNNLRQSLRRMPVNEVNREEAHTRRNNNNNRRVYLTPKPIQLPSTKHRQYFALNLNWICYRPILFSAA